MLLLYCLHFHFPGGQYLIAGGFVDGAAYNMTEVFDLVKTSSSPSFGQLPSPRTEAVGTILGNAPLICGGSEGGGSFPLYTCISYYQDSQWTQSNYMDDARQHAAGVNVNSTKFWILGGYQLSGNSLDSTEFIIQGQTNGVPGPKLPYALRGMCAIKFTNNEIFVIGGRDSDGGYRNEVWIYDPQNGFARTQGPSLTTARGFHSCSTMEDSKKTLIVVAGGYDGYQLDSVEIYNPTDNTWHSGKNKFLISKIFLLIDCSKKENR